MASQGFTAALALVAEIEEIGRRASLAGAVTVSEPLLAMRLRGAAAIHEIRRRALVHLVQQLGGTVQDPDDVRKILEHDATSVASAPSDAAVLRELAAMRLEILQAHVELLDDGCFDGAMLADLPALPPLTREA